MEALITLVLLAMPSVTLGAIVAIAIVRNGSETSRR
jgi:hypothetical protein